MNNREIKFRVWVPIANKYLNSYKKNGLVFQNGSDKDMEEFGAYDLSQCLEFNYIVQQYTGLKDANGKEIYEGDIVEETWSENYPYGYRPYEYVSKKEKFIVEYKVPSFTFPNRKGDQVIIEDYKLKVVGNIFEHPELLK